MIPIEKVEGGRRTRVTPIEKVEGMLSQVEIDLLRQIGADFGTDDSDDVLIVEIGAYKGLSTRALTEDNKARIVSIDLWDMKAPPLPGKKQKRKRKFAAPEIFETYLQNVSGLLEDERLTYVRADSREVGKIWAMPIDVLVIDGAHDGPTVALDFNNFAKHVNPGGHLLFHDAEPGGKVAKFIDGNVLVPGSVWELQTARDRFAWFRRL